MTVSSLWSVLDEAGCGTLVGIEQFASQGRRDKPERRTILAVDLSIWICEGISSTALSSFHSDPALHLVYQRTLQLLKLEVGLFFVVEGQRRVRSQTDRTNVLRKRRSGSQFWNASKRCESMLKSLGVPVLRAEAEGEALCALLNSKGLVDGVISNDGDCFLYGAKQVFTGFTSENLQARKVKRFDADNLHARIGSRTMKLSREDLIAFAMLTGSDVVGDGGRSVGPQKAIEFLRACRSVKHPCNDRTCLDELLSWGSDDVESNSKDFCLDCDDDGPTIKSRCCTLCLHPGDKLQHKKHGCEQCGTGPGEGCYIVTSSEKYLASLKEKTRGMIAGHVAQEYFAPNNNNVPDSNSLYSKEYNVYPDAKALFTTDMVLKGRCTSGSREYVRQTVPPLLARLELINTGPRNRYACANQRYKPVPIRIEKSLVKDAWPCYEIRWAMRFGDQSQTEFVTVESRSLVNVIFPELLDSFALDERRKLQQRNGEERRQAFVGKRQNRRDNLSKRANRPQQRKRERNFDGHVERARKAQKTSAETQKSSSDSNDVSMLMESMNQIDQDLHECNSSIPKDTEVDSKVNDIEGDCNAKSFSIVDNSGDVDDDKVGCDDEHLISNSLNQQLHECSDSTHLALDDFQYSMEDCGYYENEFSFTGGETNEGGLNYQHPIPFLDEQPHIDEFGGCSWCEQRDQSWEQRNKSGEHAPSNNMGFLTPSKPIFCDMGALQIEVTPMVSRRWRLF
ncbi:hypothetical protein ACHAWF_011738 [Thalassiosira exigua]